jgi:hypothetical protein
VFFNCSVSCKVFSILIRGTEMELIGDRVMKPRPKLKYVEEKVQTEQPKKKQKLVIDLDENDAIPLD